MSIKGRWAPIFIILLSIAALVLAFFCLLFFSRRFQNWAYYTYDSVLLSTRKDVLFVSTSTWPGEYADTCVPDEVCHTNTVTARCHDVLPASADSTTLPTYACTLSLNVPTDICNNNFECRVIRGKCTTVINTVGWHRCMRCYNRCEALNSYDTVKCFTACYTP